MPQKTPCHIHQPTLCNSNNPSFVLFITCVQGKRGERPLIHCIFMCVHNIHSRRKIFSTWLLLRY